MKATYLQSHTYTTQWKCEIQCMLCFYPFESFSYTLSPRLVHMGNADPCVPVFVCVNLTTPSLLSLPDEWLGTFQLFVTAVSMKRESCGGGKKLKKRRRTNQRKRGVKDKMIVELTDIWVARKSETSVCGMQECVCVFEPAVYQKAVNSLSLWPDRMVVASHSYDTWWSWVCVCSSGRSIQFLYSSQS